MFGFSHAETTGWGNHVTVGMLVTGLLLLGVFVAVERRAHNPLLPLRVVVDRNRGGSFLSIAIAGGEIFVVILFLSYYLQQNRGYSPIATGVAFLPMTAALMSAAIIGLTELQARFGPRPLVVGGMMLGALGALDLDQQRHARRCAGRLGRRLGDRQRVTAGRRLARHRAALDDRRRRHVAVLAGTLGAAESVGRAAVHGYAVGFGWAAGIFAVGAVVAAVMFTRRAPDGDRAGRRRRDYATARR